MLEAKRLDEGSSLRLISLDRVPLGSASSAKTLVCAFALLLVSLSASLVSSNSTVPLSTQAKLGAARTIQQMAHLVCHNSKVKIQSIGKMLKVIRWVSTNEHKCKSRFLSAIYELGPILERPKQLMCESDSFQLIKDYHFRFIQPPRRANGKSTRFAAAPTDLAKQQLHPEPRKYTVSIDEHDQVLIAPIEVRHFFLKFALQLSLQCKRDLVDNLRTDVQRLFDEQDREIMLMFGRDSPIGQALMEGGDATYKIDFYNVMFLPELDGRQLKDNGEEMEPPGRKQHLRTSARGDSALFKLINSCKNRYKPLYDQLILPVVRLSKLGYDYQGTRGFTQREREFLEGGELQNWLVIVHICEIFKNTVLVSVDHSYGTRNAPSSLAARPKKGKEKGARSAAPGPSAKDGYEGGELAKAADLHETDEGILVEIDDAEAKRLEEQARMERVFRPLAYKPTKRHEMEDRLMIERECTLDLELSRKHGPAGKPSGFLRHLKNIVKRAMAKLDMNRFAHYRHNSLWYSGLLNFLSSVSNVASVSVTVMGMAGLG